MYYNKSLENQEITVLDVKKVAELLAVSEKTVYRWIAKKDIPVYKVGQSYRFNQAEILEWTNRKKLNISDEIFDDKNKSEITPLTLFEGLKRGGIYYRVSGNTLKKVIESVVNIINLPDYIDRSFLSEALIARERLGTTAIGSGIAIPHVRDPIIFDLKDPVIGLCFLDNPVDLDAPDGRPVDTVFVLITSNIREHLYILSRLSYVLKINGFREKINCRSSRDEILSVFKDAVNIQAPGDGK